MRCEHYQGLISDEIDGALADKKKRKLESHLDGCSACRAYRKSLERIQAEGRLPEASPVAADYFEKFTVAIERKLRQEERTSESLAPVARRWRWAWVAAPLALVLTFGIVFFRGGGGGVRHEIFSFEDCLDRIFREIGGDEEIADDFNSYLSGSLLEGGSPIVLEDDIDLWNEPFFWRSLSDDDLRLIEAEVKKGIRS